MQTITTIGLDIAKAVDNDVKTLVGSSLPELRMPHTDPLYALPQPRRHQAPRRPSDPAVLRRGAWRACSGEQSDGHLYPIGSRGYEFVPADLPLSRSLQDALSGIRLCC